ncbi:MAG: hypothetical protein HFH16_00465 [Ruminococcus sp.]|jgi:hypothetical protein|uniref:Uncharacterized protein n=1 Tax=Schaedlerella arabinosiphila TaxID=2044587 RepID=A0A3R8JP84_9FIRM|nr:hypothetical protein [Schaedlerella arabinosiphila]MCI8722186.1 hypothetical protein [Ruminococcus sp.]RRK32321.1 hypothetical protein EBB54_13845 [Schaedlerella arabinosiphila]
MARKKQKIRIAVHTPSDMEAMFHSFRVKDFWIEKITAEIKSCRLTKEELQDFEAEMERGFLRSGGFK